MIPDAALLQAKKPMPVRSRFRFRLPWLAWPVGCNPGRFETLGFAHHGFEAASPGMRARRRAASLANPQ